MEVYKDLFLIIHLQKGSLAINSTCSNIGMNIIISGDTELFTQILSIQLVPFKSLKLKRWCLKKEKV